MSTADFNPGRIISIFVSDITSICNDLLMYDTRIMKAIYVRLNWDGKAEKSNFIIFLNNENCTVIDHLFDELMAGPSRS